MVCASVAYTMAKYGMSICVLGMAEEFRAAGIGVNALWPRTIIATAALQVIPGAEAERGRTPEIMADAAWQILTRHSRSTTGNFFIDDEVLAAAGVTDFSRYAVSPGRYVAERIFLLIHPAKTGLRLTPSNSSPASQLAVDSDYPLRQASWLRLVLNFDHNRKDRFAGISHILQRLQCEAGANLGSGRNRRGKTDPVQSVVDDHADAVLNLQRLLREVAQQGERQKSMRDSGTDRATLVCARSESRWIHWRSSVASANC